MYPVVSPELLDSSKLKTVLRGLLAFALQEAKILEYSSCFIYAVGHSLFSLLLSDQIMLANSTTVDGKYEAADFERLRFC